MSKLREKVISSIRAGSGKIYNIREQQSNFITYYSLPEGISAWFPRGNEKGITHYFDVIPSSIGENWPFAMYKERFVPGKDFVASMLVEIHKNIGPMNAQVICPRRCYDLRCPICEDMYDRQRHESDDERRKAIWMELKTQRRMLSWVIVRDGDEEEAKGVQLFEVAAFFMYDKLQPLIRDTRTGDIIFFEDPDEGKLVKFTLRKTGGGNEYLGHEFKDRIDPKTRKKYSIEDEYLEMIENIPLDSLLKVLSYEEIKEMYETGGRTESESFESSTIHPKSKIKVDGENGKNPNKLKFLDDDEAPFDVDLNEDEDSDNEEVVIDSCPKEYEIGVDFMKYEEDCEECEPDVMQVCHDKYKALKAFKSKMKRK